MYSVEELKLREDYNQFKSLWYFSVLYFVCIQSHKLFANYGSINCQNSRAINRLFSSFTMAKHKAITRGGGVTAVMCSDGWKRATPDR